MRKTIDIVVEAQGRDHGKRFRITELPAYQAEEWGLRAMSIISRAGVELPPAAMGGNMLAIFAFGIQALMGANFEEAKPLLEEMMGCVQVINVTEGGETTLRRLLPDDTEEVKTRLWLRDKVLELHTDFSVAGALLALKAPAAPSSTRRRTKTSQK